MSGGAGAILDGRRIAPSILAADYARLGAQLGEVLDAGARVIHVDVMDGHFVPPITVGPLIVAAVREQVHAVGGVLDVHLMIERPERQVAEFARAGADVITVHAEATPHVRYALDHVRESGARAGLALNPATPAETVGAAGVAVDQVLCMSVNPGWGGQRFIDGSLEKLARLRALAPPDVPVEVDGGVDEATVAGCAEAGATLFVAGSAVFGQPDPAEAYRRLAEAVGTV